MVLEQMASICKWMTIDTDIAQWQKSILSGSNP